MTVAKRNKRVKPGPELVKLADGLLKQLTKMVVERALETEKSAPNADESHRGISLTDNFKALIQDLIGIGRSWQ
jgi:hypothetical protein